MRVILAAILLFTCAPLWAQVNFVQNPDFETYSSCPDDWSQIYKAKGWRNARDSTMVYGLEYYNTCGNSLLDVSMHVPDNNSFYQFPYSGNGMAGAHFYYDKTHGHPTYPLPFNYRDYLQGHLIKLLTFGKTYCVSFYVNLTEAAGCGQNKLGAYLDNGTINISTDTPGAEILTVTPQVYTNEVLADTAAWVKIEGSFVATGTEDHITIGNFFPNAATTTVVTNYWLAFPGYSYYLIDDVSVAEIDLKADAGPDNWVEELKTIQIGRVSDPTAKAIDCKWHHKGKLIDSGAIITVNAGVKGDIDTYTVVQTICGNIKRDTVLIHTVGVGMKEMVIGNTFSVYPNPSDGLISITSKGVTGKINAVLYDLLGRAQFKQEVLSDNSTLQLEVPPGMYILELSDEQGAKQRERLQVK